MNERNDLADHLMAHMSEAERRHFREMTRQNDDAFLRENASDAVFPDRSAAQG